MISYRYHGVDAKGRHRRGRTRASSEADLEQKLHADGIWVLEVRPEVASGPVRPGKVRIRRRELSQFCAQMEFLTRVGIPLVQGLEMTARDGEHRRWASLLLELKQHLESGMPLAAAMEIHPEVFRPEFTQLIRAGESSGSLPEAFAELRKHLEWQEKIAGDVRQATLYPLTVLVAAILFVGVLFTVVVPKFAALLSLVKVPLPWPTRIVFAISTAFRSPGILVLVIPVLGIAAAAFFRRSSTRLARAGERAMLRLPIWGELLRLLIVGRFARSLAVLYRNGVSLLPALELVRNLLGSRVAADAVGDVTRRIESGESLSDALSAHSIFPPLIVRLTRVGERTGQLDQTLESVATYYLDLVPQRVQRLLGLLEPALILGLVGLVGFVALAVYLPILSLIQHLR
ncbi:MAG: type II secretion system F family protein [Verrucomicrobiales bacterium]|nr:type II secretion system F family protein [Verrucomicrobiales bacterium]